jgi:hypothetical protein
MAGILAAVGGWDGESTANDDTADSAICGRRTIDGAEVE